MSATIYPPVQINPYIRVYSFYVNKPICTLGNCEKEVRHECYHYAHGNNAGSECKHPQWCLRGCIADCVNPMCPFNHMLTRDLFVEYRSQSPEWVENNQEEHDAFWQAVYDMKKPLLFRRSKFYYRNLYGDDAQYLQNEHLMAPMEPIYMPTLGCNVHDHHKMSGTGYYDEEPERAPLQRGKFPAVI